MVAIVIRSRGDIASFDPDPRDASVIKHDAEEGQVSVARRSRDEAAEEQVAVGAEVLDQRAGFAISALYAGSAPIWLVNICEDRAEAPDRCWLKTIGTRYKEDSFGDIAADRREQPRRAKGAEDGAIGRITK